MYLCQIYLSQIILFYQMKPHFYNNCVKKYALRELTHKHYRVPQIQNLVQS